MGVDAVVLVNHNLSLDEIYELPNFLKDEKAFPNLHTLAKAHPHWLSTNGIKTPNWSWIFYEKSEDFWFNFGFNNNMIEMDAGHIILDCYPKLFCLATIVRWYIYAYSFDLADLCTKACGELAAAFGGDKCVHLADIVDERETWWTIEQTEEMLRQKCGEPAQRFSDIFNKGYDDELAESDIRYSVSSCSYYVHRFDKLIVTN